MKSMGFYVTTVSSAHLYQTTMDTVLFLIACLTEFGITSVIANEYLFTKTTDLSGQTCTAEDVEFTKEDVSLLAICANFCSLSENCASFFYAESTLKCHGCGFMEHPPAGLTGSVHYKREKTGHMYIGCYGDCLNNAIMCLVPDNRVMNHTSRLEDSSMTEQLCFQHCLSFNSPYFGLESGFECFCGDEGYSRDGVVDRCNGPCQGNSSQICGGPTALSVFKYTW